MDMTLFQFCQAVFGLFLYFFSEGITEGLSFSGSTRTRKVLGFDYHSWRYGELLGIGIITEIVFGLLTTLGFLFLFSFIYERMLQYAQGDGFWALAGTYRLMGLRVKWSWTIDIGRLIIGALLLYFGIPTLL